MTLRSEPSGEKRTGAASPQVASLVRTHQQAETDGKVKAVIVSGMHRSGSTTLTRVLIECGLQPPSSPGAAPADDDLYCDRQSNPIVSCSDALLRGADSGWNDPFASRPHLVGRYSAEAIQTVKTTLTAQFSLNRDLALHDPRIAVLFGPWKSALLALDLDIKLIIPVRHPLQVAASLAESDGFPPVMSSLIWLSHLIALERDSRDVSRVFIAYEDLIRDWRACFRRVERNLGLRLPGWNDESALKIDKLISAQARQGEPDSTSLRERSDIPSWVADAYDWALLAAREAEEPRAHALDQIAQQFHASAELLAPLLSYHRHRREEPRIDAGAAPVAAAGARAVDISRALDLANLGTRRALKALADRDATLQRLDLLVKDNLKKIEDHLETKAARERELASLRQQFAQAQIEAEQARERELAELLQQSASTQFETEQRFEADLAELKRQLNEARHSAEQWKTEAIGLRQTWSWRLTAPLRVLRRALPQVGAQRFTNLGPRLARRIRSWLSPRPAVDPSTEASPLFDALFSMATSRGEHYVALPAVAAPTRSRIRTIAFYLPQFHPIPENDAWWGKGFTEWTNVSKATPQFVGHYQPRLPDELGYYDLRLLDVQRRQVELAKLHGLYGFCFHYYWFSGRRRLLERPLNQFVQSDIDFPFCVCWANENWTRRWDGLEQDILMEQRHDPEDDLMFIEDLAPLLRDSRYIRVDGRPLIIVYRVDIIPHAERLAQTWRDYCQAHGLGDPYLVAAQTFGTLDPRPYGFDAAVEFPPHKVITAEIQHQQKLLNPAFGGKVYSYAAVSKRESTVKWPDYPLYKSVMPAWDNEARKPGKGHVFQGSTPAHYAAWLRAVCEATDKHHGGDNKLVFVNAWNEWAEGAYLEPDRRFGYAYLQATKQVLAEFPDAPARPGETWPPLHIIVHAFFPEIFAEILEGLALSPAPFSLTVTTTADRSAAVMECFARSGLKCQFELIIVENRGRDVWSLIEGLRRANIPSNAVVLKLHTKRTEHRRDGSVWRQSLLGELLDPSVIALALDAFAGNERLSYVAPSGHILPLKAFIGENQPAVEDLLRRGAWSPIDPAGDQFIAGNMFFARREAFDSLLALALSAEEFEPEPIDKDGTLAHAVERLFAMVAAREGGLCTDVGALKAGRDLQANTHFAFANKTDYRFRSE